MSFQDTSILNRKNSVVRSFRFDANLAKLLSRAAQARNLSENSFVSLELKKRLEAEPIVRVFEEITLSKESLISILEAIDSESVETLGALVATRQMRLELDILNLERDISSLRFYLTAILADHRNWFRLELSPSQEEVLLVHGSGMKWSLFLKGYLSKACETEFRLNYKVTPEENFVKVIFQERFLV